MKKPLYVEVDLIGDMRDMQLFYECIEDLLQFDDVLKLQGFSQHLHTSRLQHSINVAYYSFIWCKTLDLDYRSAARAGILHDLFLYDWRTERQPEGHHAKAHPIVALRNAKKLTTLNSIEEDAILKHMWPVTPRPPKYKESMIVSLADKLSACNEIGDHFRKKYARILTIAKNIAFGSIYAR